MRIILLSLAILISGCGKISPFSPELDQKINNQHGQIEDIRNNQNGFMLELMKIRQQSEINARDIKNAQQGLVNIRGTDNSGIQIFSGDGGIMLFMAFIIFLSYSTCHYRNQAKMAQKTSEILAQQVTLHDDPNLTDKILLSALNTEVEAKVYRMITKN